MKKLKEAWQEVLGKTREQRKAKMKELLRLQAQDFAAWLKK